ncbi:hypothetical protein CTI12_AA420670 [Artemisia annua]|uniref:CTLH domain-containing protein n=1 Tax=Artemisia annua TaxID=35608 RepID=A0A2U1M0P6_ARTAN|nr:hypothetical protein CTI12_AA420670 [Artemisia annua]
MSSLYRELVFLILRFQNEEMFKDTVHRLEQESGFFFNMHHFEELVMSGEWEKVENYLAAFTKVDDNKYSMKIYFEMFGEHQFFIKSDVGPKIAPYNKEKQSVTISL